MVRSLGEYDSRGISGASSIGSRSTCAATMFAAPGVARGQSPSTASPNNATINAALKMQPPFTRIVSIRPHPSCPEFRMPESAPEREERSGITPDPLLDRPHVTSAEGWEAIHHATGMPIVADTYTRLHAVPSVTVEDKPLFDALCKLGDELRLHWKKDGDFLLGRSTSYFRNKLKEIPHRHLERWTAFRRDRGGLPLETLLEMVALLDSATSRIGATTEGYR